MISVRRAESDDWDDIVAADAQLFDANDPKLVPEHEFWIAEADGVFAGYAAVRPSMRFLDAVYLSRCGVLPFARGLRLQLRLIRARERWGRAHGATWSITDTAPSNAASINTLIRAGYRTYSPEIKWGGPTSTYWRRRLVRST